MLFFKKNNINDDDIRTYSIHDVLGTVLSALCILTQKYASQLFYGIYPHKSSLIISGLPVKDRAELPFISCIMIGKSPPFPESLSITCQIAIVVSWLWCWAVKSMRINIKHFIRCLVNVRYSAFLFYLHPHISWNKNHLFLYWILRTWHVTCNQCLLSEWMDTWSNKMNNPISTLLNWCLYMISRSYWCSVGRISVLTVGSPWPNLLVISILLSLD